VAASSTIYASSLTALFNSAILDIYGVIHLSKPKPVSDPFQWICGFADKTVPRWWGYGEQFVYVE